MCDYGKDVFDKLHIVIADLEAENDQWRAKNVGLKLELQQVKEVRDYHFQTLQGVKELMKVFK